jgi:uncharacterized protein YabN with tetrapyrrole methylase and pyrophosphatase domain
VADAIARRDPAALKDGLGDLLFQVVFHARMAEEAGMFAFDDVAGAIADKMALAAMIGEQQLRRGSGRRSGQAGDQRGARLFKAG